MSYIPGTEANRVSRAENGQDPNYGTGNNQGYGSGSGSGNTGRGVASYIPGTEANRESRAEHGQDPNRYTGSGSGNQGYGSNTGSNTGNNITDFSCLLCWLLVNLLPSRFSAIHKCSKVHLYSVQLPVMPVGAVLCHVAW